MVKWPLVAASTVVVLASHCAETPRTDTVAERVIRSRSRQLIAEILFKAVMASCRAKYGTHSCRASDARATGTSSRRRGEVIGLGRSLGNESILAHDFGNGLETKLILEVGEDPELHQVGDDLKWLLG